MRYLRVAAVSLNQIPLDWIHNKNNIISAIEDARNEGVSVLCCPELCISGYGCEDAFLSKSTREMVLTVLQEIVPYTHNIVVAVGLPLSYRDNLYNAACLIVNGKIAGFSLKQNLANDGIHYESRWFTAWKMDQHANIELNNELYPIGDLVYQISGYRIGFEICEDAWVPHRTGNNLAKRGVDLILNPSASHFHFGKAAIRKRFVQEGADIFGVGYIYANLLGNEAGRVIYDGDTIIAQPNEILTSGPRFSYQDRILTATTIDIKSCRANRSLSWDFKDTDDEGTVTSSFVIKESSARIPSNRTEMAWESSVHLKEEEFTRSVTLGLFDYLRKSKSRGFVLNLSGGADSCACASLVYLMVKLCLQELGPETFQAKLAYISDISLLSLKSPNLYQSIIKALLFCLYQKTENNTVETQESAELLAKAISAPFANIEIDFLIHSYIDLLEPIIGKTLTWEEDDILLQNLQTRVRSPSIWLIANLRKALLICTSNRSEASVGYATMDGDTAGGVCPLAGIDKYFIQRWLVWLEKIGLEHIKIPALSKVNQLVPSAELRPLDKHQTDETDLMPYCWLEAIERLFVRDKCSPVEIFIAVTQQFPKEPPQSLAVAIERFFKLWVANQWKRERFAPSFHLDDENVDPKTGFRYPILSGNYERELKILWERVRMHH
jgi:NAD+ synthase (glutamine-hydrolysing)